MTELNMNLVLSKAQAQALSANLTTPKSAWHLRAKEEGAWEEK